MSEHATDAMQQFGAAGPLGQGTNAGLILLYAEAFASLPSVWPLRTTAPSAIGSSAAADLVLPVPAVSRQHAEIVRRLRTR